MPAVMNHDSAAHTPPRIAVDRVGLAAQGQPNGVWLWGLGSGGDHRPLFRQLLVCAFHAESRAVATRPDGGPTAPVILAASRECIP